MSIQATSNLLAIECSQRAGSVALTRDGDEIEFIGFASGGREEDLLLPSIDALLHKAGLTPDELGGIGVSIGPGGFTGLRIAVATAKGIAEVTGCLLHAVPSALVAAEAIKDDLAPGDRVVVASAAKLDTCWLTSLERLADGWKELPGIGIHTIVPPGPDVLAMCDGALVLADEHVPAEFHERITKVARARQEPLLDAVACLRVTCDMARRGVCTDPLELVPLYPREPEAVRSWRLRH
jgi:tRNA threonylcarbamoyladenosine biosynthesis protein TsaB